MFSVALAVQMASTIRPGCYPAHCPAEFGLSSPTQHLAVRAAAIIRPPAPPVYLRITSEMERFTALPRTSNHAQPRAEPGPADTLIGTGKRVRMEFKEAVKIALQSLWANKLRSVLTLLGVVIGVASVIAVVTLVNGANTFVTTKFTSYGADVFTVSKMPSTLTSPDDYVRFQKRKDILFPDYEYIKTNCKRCTGIGAQQASTGKIVRGTQSVTDTSIRGYTAQMPALQNLNIEQGRGFTDTDEEHASHVALIGTHNQDHLFAGVNPIGQELRVDGTPYTVIGVSEKQGSTFGASQDNWVAVPLTAFQKSYGTAKTLKIYIKAGQAGPVLETAADEVRVLVRSSRHDAPGAED